MTLTYINYHLNTHEKCVKYLEEKRWKGIPICPYCGCNKSSPKKLRYTCLKCKNSYSVTVGTVLENSNLPLYKWLMAITLILAAKKGISAMQLSRDLTVNKNTAWLLQMKIRGAMKEGKIDLFIKRKNRSRSAQQKSLDADFSRKNAFGYWTMLKRAIIGQYHKIDTYYLSRYTDEIEFKFNRKHLIDRGYDDLLQQLLFLGIAK